MCNQSLGKLSAYMLKVCPAYMDMMA